MHWFSALMVFAGSWLSGYFIVATDAWMQHPVGYATAADGSVQLTSFWQLVLNPWALVAVRAQHERRGGHGRVRDGGGRRLLPAVAEARGAGTHFRARRRDRRLLIFSVLQCFPPAIAQGKMVAEQSAGDAGRDGSAVRRRSRARRWSSSASRTSQSRRSTIRYHVPKMLSFLTYRRWNAEVQGLNAFPQEHWPDNIPLAVLQLPHHGGAGDDLHRGHGGGCVPAVARHAVQRALDAVDPAADACPSPTSPTPPAG